MRRIAGLGVAFLLCATVRVGAQANRCADCHFANLAHVPAPQGLAAWSRSAHGKHGVACSSCHGGDPTTYQSVAAHRGVLDGRHPLSSVNRANLPLTCASCHAAIVAEYRTSAHATAADRDAPVCTTCHGMMGGERPSASRIPDVCSECHHTNPAHAAYGSLARDRVEALNGLDETLARVETSIAGIADQQKRARLSAELLLARAAVRTAAESVHTFDFHVMDAQRATAQRRVSELITALMAAN